MSIHQRQLDALSTKNKPLSQLEKSAAERSLQILVESAISCAKHLNKKEQLPDRLDAYQSMQQVIEEHNINPDYLPQLKGAIGMRNAIVHDYLNLDWDIIQIVLNEQKYTLLVNFSLELCGFLAVE
jgi:uncharacterized protein YutE (UPF0331/DUF86 family)